VARAVRALRFIEEVQVLEFIARATMIIITMTTRENEFEPRLGKPPADQAPKAKGVRAVARQLSPRRQSSGKASGAKPRQPSIRAHFAPGSKTRARLPRSVAVAVALVDPLAAAFAVGGAGEACYLQLHQPLGREADHVTQEIGVRALLQERTKRHRVVCHRGVLG